VAEAFDQDMLSGTYDDYAIQATLVDTEVTPEALWTGADLSSSWLGEASCEPEAMTGAGREPQLDLSDSAGSSMAVGLTEYQLNSIMRELMADGFFCFDDSRMDLVYEAVAELFDPNIAGLQASASLLEAPLMLVETAGAEAIFEGISLEVRGTVQGEELTLLAMEADLSAVADLGVDPTLAALTLSLHELQLNMLSLDAEHLLSDSPDAQEHLEDFLEGWVVDWVEEQVQGIALFAAQYHLFGTYLRLDRVLYEPGGVAIYASLYDEDDPAVDLEPPDTTAWVEETLPDQAAARLAWSGSDDRSSALAYAWRQDGGGWSSWSTDTELLWEELSPGQHQLQVQARDGWLNVDASPASVSFELDAPAVELVPERSCGCTSTGRGGWAWPALLLAALLARRRQR